MNYEEVIVDLMKEVTVRTKKKPSLSEEKLEFLKSIVMMIEPVEKASYSDVVDFLISDNGKDLAIAFCGEDLEIQNGRKNPFYELVAKASSAKIDSQEDYARVILTFTDIWELVDVE